MNTMYSAEFLERCIDGAYEKAIRDSAREVHLLLTQLEEINDGIRSAVDAQLPPGQEIDEGDENLESAIKALRQYLKPLKGVLTRQMTEAACKERNAREHRWRQERAERERRANDKYREYLKGYAEGKKSAATRAATQATA